MKRKMREDCGEPDCPVWTKDDFADYLDNTFIPDLMASGNTETANDFGEVVTLLQTGRPADPEFIAYLRQLAADNNESGNTATAEDYETAAELLGGNKMESATSKNQLLAIKDVDTGEYVEDVSDSGKMIMTSQIRNSMPFKTVGRANWWLNSRSASKRYKVVPRSVKECADQIVKQALAEAEKTISESFSTNRVIDRAVAYLKAHGAGPHAEPDFRRAAAGMEDHEVIQLFAELADISPEEAETEIADY